MYVFMRQESFSQTRHSLFGDPVIPKHPKKVRKTNKVPKTTINVVLMKIGVPIKS